MTRRLALITTLLVLAIAAPAGAQGGAFGPLPPAQPTPTATATPNNQDNTETGVNVLIIIGVALIAGFGLMGYFIMRDARGAADKVVKADVLEHEKHRSDALHKRQQLNKAKQRKKGSAQKQARKVQRNR
jgi:uncharacterized protein HemX